MRRSDVVSKPAAKRCSSSIQGGWIDTLRHNSGHNIPHNRQKTTQHCSTITIAFDEISSERTLLSVFGLLHFGFVRSIVRSIDWRPLIHPAEQHTDLSFREQQQQQQHSLTTVTKTTDSLTLLLYIRFYRSNIHPTKQQQQQQHAKDSLSRTAHDIVSLGASLVGTRCHSSCCCQQHY